MRRGAVVVRRAGAHRRVGHVAGAAGARTAARTRVAPLRERAKLQEHVRTHTAAGLCLRAAAGPPSRRCQPLRRPSPAGQPARARGTHTGERRSRRRSAGAPVARAEHLRAHALSLHARQRPFACDECGATHSTRAHLATHRRRAHTGERPFACAHCARAFVLKEHLKNHVRARHTGARPYACPAPGCTRAYATSTAMRKHQRQAHPDPDPAH
ncbi:Krueppel homolog 1 [Gryllus bimaculatus]|nr:Krueppel homolog 1 [Gryllus bimaculatus]